MASAEFVLTGTGWASNLEREAIRMARSHRVQVAAYLDHWVNYAERFTVDGVLELPDEIWVGDEEALDLAHRTFPTTEVRLEPNQYWSEIRAELAGMGQAGHAVNLRRLSRGGRVTPPNVDNTLR